MKMISTMYKSAKDVNQFEEKTYKVPTPACAATQRGTSALQLGPQPQTTARHAPSPTLRTHETEATLHIRQRVHAPRTHAITHAHSSRWCGSTRGR